MKRALQAVGIFLKNHPLGILLFAIVASLAANYIYSWLHKQPEVPPRPLTADEFRVRFRVMSPAFTENDLKRMPEIVHCNASVGGLAVTFDLSLIPTIVSPGGYQRSYPVPEIWYESKNMWIPN